MKILSPSVTTHTHVFQDQYDFLSSKKQKIRYFAKFLSCLFLYENKLIQNDKVQNR